MTPWIADRDHEGTTLLVVEKSSRTPVGVIILFESTREGTCTVDLRLGYLLSEDSWGQGFACDPDSEKVDTEEPLFRLQLETHDGTP